MSLVVFITGHLRESRLTPFKVNVDDSVSCGARDLRWSKGGHGLVIKGDEVPMAFIDSLHGLSLN
jgi:hypothetical protein